MYFQFKEKNIWRSQHTVRQHMLEGFATQFDNTCVILDITKIPIPDKPQDVKVHLKWSNYVVRRRLHDGNGAVERWSPRQRWVGGH